MKIRISFLCCIIMVLITTLVTGKEQPNLSLEKIINEIKNNDSMIKSGECDVVYKSFQWANIESGNPGNDDTYRYHIIFDQGKIRIDIPEQFNNRFTIKKDKIVKEGQIRTPQTLYIRNDDGTNWRISQFSSAPTGYDYMFSTNTRDRYFREWDPRYVMRNLWSGESLPEHLKKQGFKVIGQENFQDAKCHILKNAKGEKIWIAPEQGFRFLKREEKVSIEHDTLSGLEKGTPVIFRYQSSYYNIEKAWFPKHFIYEMFMIDKNEKEHLVLRNEYETDNIRLNNPIAVEKFTIEIPENAIIGVAETGETLSKADFLKLYGKR